MRIDLQKLLNCLFYSYFVKTQDNSNIYDFCVLQNSNVTSIPVLCKSSLCKFWKLKIKLG